MQVIQRPHVETVGLLARPHKLRKQSRKVLAKHVDRRRVIIDADLGLEGKELTDSGGDGGRRMHAWITLKRSHDDGALFVVETRHVAQYAKRRIAIPKPVVGVFRKGGFVIAQAQRCVWALVGKIAGDNAVLDQAAEQKARSAGREGEA